jgi:hypothetical protein
MEMKMAGRGRPRKITLEKDTIMAEEFYGDVKQMVRRIAKGHPIPDQGVFDVYTVDKQLDEWTKQGYKLFNTHFRGVTPESYDVMYILVRE